TSESGYTNDFAEEMGLYWSGWMFDDISVRSLEIATTPTWTDTIVIPGPLEPCDTYHDQFEWEDVPYCMYKICVEAECEGDIDMDDNILCQQIYVVDDLEWATDPKVESFDHTGTDGCWGLCGSDVDWYLSTNPDSETYDNNLDCSAVLCPDGESCIDITHLWPTGPVGTPTQIFYEDFELGLIPPMWSAINPGVMGWFADFYGSGTYGEPAGGGTFFANIDSDLYGPGETGSLITPPIDLTAGGTAVGNVDFNFESNFQWVSATDYGELWLLDLGVRTQLLKTYMADELSFETFSINPGTMIDPTTAQFEFFYDDDLWWAWNWGVDDVEVIAYIGGAPATLNLEIEFDYWCDIEYGWDFVYLEVSDGCPGDLPDDWQLAWYITGEELWTGGWQHAVVDLAPYVTGNEFMLRFRMLSDSSGTLRGFLLDNVFIADLFDVTQITDPFPVYEDF
ncbi:MAG: hypothetical protein JW779_10255, partial [Candidatus Thorarchaeota archaeon]|nr:hypothetical protein [Candidatus Thorarchaeota archaeon]